MNNEHMSDATLMYALACVNTRMIDLVVALGRNPRMSNVVRICDIRRYDKTTVFESYVEVDVSVDTALCWEFEIQENEQSWTVVRSIVKTATEGQDIVMSFPDRVFADSRELCCVVDAMAKELCETTQEV